MSATHRGTLALTDVGATSGLFFNNANTVDPATTGQITYVSGTGFRAYGASGVVTLGAAGAGGTSTWEALFSADQTFSITSTGWTIAGSAAVGASAVTTISGASTGSSLALSNSSTGKELAGASWSVVSSGGVGIVELGSGGTINATDGAISIGKTTTATTIVGTLTCTEAATFSSTVAAGATTITGLLTLATSGTTGITAVTTDTTVPFSFTASSVTASTIFGIIGAGTLAGASAIGLGLTFAGLTTGTALSITDASISTGIHINVVEAASVFSVSRYGATVIAGTAAGTDVLTLTTGDILFDDSDQNIIESEDGTTTLLLLDNKAGAVGSAEAVLKVDAGGVVNAAGFGIYATFTGAAAAGATVVGVVPDAGSLGIFVNAGGVATREALKVDADTTGNYHVVSFHSDSVLASDYAVLNVDTGGALAAGAHLVKFDLGAGIPGATAIPILIDAAAITGTTEPVVMKIDAGGKVAQALLIDADPTAKDAVGINCDSVIAADKGALQIITTGAIAAGGTAMRFDITGTPNADARVLEFDLAGVTDTNEPYAIYIDGGGKKIRALHIDADPVTNDLVYIHSDAVIADNKALVNIHQATGIMAGGSALLRLECDSAPAASFYLQEVDMTGITATNNPGGIWVNGTGTDVTGIVVDTDNTDIEAVSITGTGALTSAGNMLLVDNDGAPAASANVVKFSFTGTATNNPTILDLYGTGKDCQAISSDTDNTATNAVEITGTGALTSAGSMLSVSSDGTAAAGASIVKFAFTGTDTNTPNCVFIDHNSIGNAISVDQDGNSASAATGIAVNTDNAGAGNQIALQVTMVDESKSYLLKMANAVTAWTSTKNPETDAESGWLKIDINGTAFYLPFYSA